ncbi:MAG: hypothetical protein EBX48_04540 [Actinobacteria bacterium]|nr:hypothetical protein [Actinomycetota bacterium]NDG69389.1 hypothetical protein [Actinomycetota bacterium]
MRITLLAILIAISSITNANSACEGETCIDVKADQESNEVVITVKKGKAGRESSTSPKPKPTPKPRVKQPWIPWLPKPVLTNKAVAQGPKPSPKPRVKRISGSQISDQVKSLIPRGEIITQPLDNILVNQSVNFMTNTPMHFTTVLVVLGTPITIHLTPEFSWQFGDGNSYGTRLAGAPYPLMLIENTYKSSGQKRVELTTTWSGFWRAGSLSAPIDGAIVQKVSRQIDVRLAKGVYRG